MFPPPEETEITPAELQALLETEASPAFHLIDCREEDEFVICRIEDSTLIPLSRFAEDGPAFIEATPRPTVVLCHHGMRSMNATMYLREKGFEQVWSLVGGIDLWSTQIDSDVPRY